MRLGEKLYRYADLGKVFEYTVAGVINRSNGETLELRCENCNDHDGCLVMVQQNGSDYVYREMKYPDDQYFWHNDGFYRTTKQAALNDMYKRMIANHEQGIETAQKNIDFHNEQIAKIKAIGERSEEDK